MFASEISLVNLVKVRIDQYIGTIVEMIA
jgi:hypothetical protein